MPQTMPFPDSENPSCRIDQGGGDVAQRVWDYVSRTELHSLWNFEGTHPWIILKRTAHAFMEDDLLSRAAELGFYFLFALFPMLVSASSILGLAARSAHHLYDHLLLTLAMVVPASAYDLVIETFNQTAQASSSGKITIGLVVAIWSASIGFAAIQDTMNLVYKVRETRPYWKARGSAVLVTVLLAVLATVNLADLFFGDRFADSAQANIWHHSLRVAAVVSLHLLTWIIACGLLMLIFSTIYYFAPNVKTKRWHWLTPGAAIGILIWVLVSLGFRAYLHFFNSYSITYGSLGAVIVLLMWFYLTGLSLLTGAEINSEIQAAVIEKRLKETGHLRLEAFDDGNQPLPYAAAVPNAR